MYLLPTFKLIYYQSCFSTLNIEVTFSSETSFNRQWTTQSYNQEQKTRQMWSYFLAFAIWFRKFWSSQQSHDPIAYFVCFDHAHKTFPGYDNVRTFEDTVLSQSTEKGIKRTRMTWSWTSIFGHRHCASQRREADNRGHALEVNTIFVRQLKYH